MMNPMNSNGYGEVSQKYSFLCGEEYRRVFVGDDVAGVHNGNAEGFEIDVLVFVWAPWQSGSSQNRR
jgi:hypothetical protein